MIFSLNRHRAYYLICCTNCRSPPPPPPHALVLTRVTSGTTPTQIKELSFFAHLSKFKGLKVGVGKELDYKIVNFDKIRESHFKSQND